MLVEQREMQKKAALSGLLFGVILLCIGIPALYVIAQASSMAVVIGSPVLLSFIVPILLAVFFCISLRKQVGGYWSFREATGGIFVLFITAYLLYSAGSHVHTHYIDKKIAQEVKENVLNVTTTFASKQNIPAEELDEKIDEMKENMEEEKNPSTGKLIQSVLFSIIILFIGALLFAAIFKKEEPLFNEPTSNP